jgi:hypothetical protein
VAQVKVEAEQVPLSRPLSAGAVAFAQKAGVAVYHEFFGAGGYKDPQAALHLQLGIANGLMLSPPVESGMLQLTAPYNAGLMLRMAASAVVAGTNESEIERQRAAFGALAAAHPTSDFLWSLMFEWDQSGGQWVLGGRPRYTGLSREAAQERFLAHYSQRHPLLINYLQHPPADKVLLTAVTDMTPNVFSTYEMGADLCLLERGNDELGDIATGVAFLRGAASQYGRPWGIDMSTWRGSTNMATRYSEAGVLLGGWSADFIRRNLYASYMAGARLIQTEAATYTFADGRLNPLGVISQDFADFALRRHADIGAPVVTTALLVNPVSGFDTKHGAFNQDNAVWYQDLPYNNGDFMMDNFLRLAYPNHWLQGLAPNAPFANSAGVPNQTQFRAYLAGGGDPRPYEPIPTTRWGDSMNVITTGASLSALDPYKLIIMLGDVKLSARLRADLLSWVRKGGVLLMNSAQIQPEDEVLTGASVQGQNLMASSSKWTGAGSESEFLYLYSLFQTSSAEVRAVNERGDPLVLRNSLGLGEVWLTTPQYAQSTGHQLLQVSVQLLDQLQARFAPVRVSGAPVQYVVNQSADKLTVTVINNSGTQWSGDIVVPRDSSGVIVREYISDRPVSFSPSGAELTLNARVAPYDVGVFAVEFGSLPQPGPASDRRRR